jgi:hypothetical protein
MPRPCPTLPSRRRATRSPAWAFAALTLLVALAACTQEKKEERFARGSEIALADYTVRLSAVEARAAGQGRSLILHLQTTGVGSHEDAGRFMAQFHRRGAIRLRDSSGKTHRLSLLQPADIYRTQAAALDNDMESMLQAAERMNLGAWNEWVAIFNTPADSADFTLVLENPEPRKGQPQIAAVPVGR